MGLRGYQKRMVRAVRRQQKSFRSIVLVEFPGAGKTHEAAQIIRADVAKGARVLILAHRAEILKQTLAKLMAAGIPRGAIGFIWGQYGLNLSAPVQIASVQTLARRAAPKHIDLVVVDEAHHVQARSWRKILSWYPRAKVLGLTATPERLDGKPLREIFERMVLGEPCEKLIVDGWVVRPEIWTREDAWRPKVLRRGGGDYAAKDAAHAMSRSTIIGGIPRSYLKHARGLPAVGFAATKDQAKKLIAAFHAVGVTSEPLFDDHSERERETILARLKSGETKVVWTCDILGEGWDYPGARCVILARPTLSVARYIQWCGRGMRPGARSVILDHAGNYAVHGPPWEEREWSLDGRPRRSKLAAQVDLDGRVSFLEPIEVDGKLVRADALRRQTVCAGFRDQPCPQNRRPAPEVFCPRNVRGRGGGPWRCFTCARWHRSRVPIEFFLRPVQQAVCAGWGGVRCPTARATPSYELRPGNVWRRNGEPYRCTTCAKRHRSKYVADPTYVQSEQKVCPGFAGRRCPAAAVPPTTALSPHNVRSRKGAQWRCHVCSNHMAAAHPNRKAMLKRSAVTRIDRAEKRRRRLRKVCCGWRGPCPDKAMPPDSALAPYMIRRRGGEPWRCHLCAQRRRHRFVRVSERKAV